MQGMEAQTQSVHAAEQGGRRTDMISLEQTEGEGPPSLISSHKLAQHTKV